MEIIYKTTALLIFTSLVILGFHIVTSGREEHLPNGGVKKVGKLLYFIRHYFDSYTIVPTYYVEVLPFVAKINSVINSEFKNPLAKNIKIHDDGAYALLEKSNMRFDSASGLLAFKMYLEDKLGCKVDIDDNEFNYEMRFYKDEKVYKFSDLIKDPLYNCPPCMASLWGGSSYVLAQAFGFLDYGSFGLNVFMAFPYILALVCLNNMNKKING